MKAEKINGLIVVRKPQLCGNTFTQTHGDVTRNTWHPDPAVFEGRQYYGLERSQWGDLGDAYFSKVLSAELENIYRNVRNSARGLIRGVDLTQEEEQAKTVLDYCNREENICEVIAILSEIVSENQGTIKAKLNVKWIGYDVFKIASWSLIRHGIFRCNEFFNKWSNKLNKYGLLPILSNEENLRNKNQIIEDHDYYQKKDLTEDFPGGYDEYVDLIKIGMVQL